MVKTVSVDEAQRRLLELLDERIEFVITKNGLPVARVIPIVRDIVEPVDGRDAEK